ncbi:zf-HC2 domain-containing protein [Streptomyces sp. NPDC048191]|uniref:zf-HC2 domain-containing protein n=1 Tax=Streptomyces sp. NPDC048191 TaxID=3155484 RepID=UPI0033D3DF1D
MAVEHLGTQALRDYQGRQLSGAALQRADTHLAVCAACRAGLTRYADQDRTAAIWARLVQARDVPRPGAVERVLLALRVPGHTARLITATPALRRSWLAGAVVTLLLTLVVARLGHAVSATLPFFVVAPALPVAGVALSFGPRTDPMYEMTVVAPFHGLRLLLLRTVTVVTTALVPAAAIAVALPGPAPRTLGWLLPSLALTSLTLALSARVEPVVAAGAVGGTWALCLLVLFEPVRDLVLSAGGQLGAAAVLCGTAVSIALTRTSYDRGAPRPAH